MPQDATNAVTKPHTLLAEDEDWARSALATAMRKRGMHVTETATIADALDAVGDLGDSLDLAVLDYFLPPGESRKAWCRASMERSVAPRTAEIITDAMANLRTGTAVLFITGHSREAMRPVLRRTNAFGCLHKPFSTGLFLDAVDHVLHWHDDRTSLLDALTSTERPVGLRDGVFRAAMRLANLAPDEKEEMVRVLRTALEGVEIDAACKTCGMSRAKYNRKKTELRAALGRYCQFLWIEDREAA